ncbi:DMSO reductase [Thermodesulfobacteriota bacterium]
MSTKLFRYEWMVKPTPQSAWIEGKGVWLWLAFFFTEIGAGIYFVSLFLNYPPGCLIGYLVALALGGIVHMAYLGNPMRAWRIFLKPKTSELSRGLWATLLFAAIGFFQVVPVVFSFLPWSGGHVVLRVIMGILCVMLISHGFLTMNVVRALPMWNSPMMIPLSVISGIWVGSQAVEFFLGLSGANLGLAEIWSRWSLLAYMGVLLMFLFGTSHTSETGRLSIKGIVAGELAARFYIGVVVIGIIVPLIITLVIWGSGAEKLNNGVIFLRFLCVLIGDLMMRHAIMKGARYAPLV